MSVAPSRRSPTGLVWNESGGRVQLLAHQVEHFDQLHAIVQKYTTALDTSVMGTGKTFTSLALAVALDLPVFVVCLVQSELMWRESAESVGVRVVDVVSYETLRGRADLERLSHPWLIREDRPLVNPYRQMNTRESKMRYITSFRPTQDLLQVIARGALFVFDEVQKIRNPCAQTVACHAILRAVINTNKSPDSRRKSYALMLSATPAISVDNIVRHARLMGIITQDTLFTRNEKRQIIPRGIAEMVTVATHFDAGTTRQVLEECPISDEESVKLLCYKLWVKVISRSVVSAMHQIRDSASVYAYNAHFSLRRFPYDLRWFRDQMRGVTEILADEGTPLAQLNESDALGKLRTDAQSLKRVHLRGTAMFKNIEASKVRAQIEMAVAEKMRNPHLKIVFNYRFSKSIEIARYYLARIFGAEQVGVIRGKTHELDRHRIIERFNARGTSHVPENPRNAELRRKRAARIAKLANGKLTEEEASAISTDFGSFANVREWLESGEEADRSALESELPEGGTFYLTPEELSDKLERYEDISERFENDDETGERGVRDEPRDLPDGEGPISFLIGQREIISASLNLQEREEGMVRMMFIGATGDVTAIHQARGRFKRAGSRGTAFVYVAFGLLEQEDEDVEIRPGMGRHELDAIIGDIAVKPRITDAEANFIGVEANMFRALDRKSSVLKDTLTVQVEDGEIFPSDYPIIKIR